MWGQILLLLHLQHTCQCIIGAYVHVHASNQLSAGNLKPKSWGEFRNLGSHGQPACELPYLLIFPKLATLIQSERLPGALVPKPNGSYSNDLFPSEVALQSLPQAIHQRLADGQYTFVAAVLGSKETKQIRVAYPLRILDVVLTLIR